MNLADRGELTGFLRKHGLSADKSLGQHFLCAPNVVRDIVSAAGSYKGCLEVGPGPGILTSFLVEKSQAMTAVEFDSRMVPLLADSAPNCEVLVGDALKVDLGEVLKQLPEPRALVSNMPYYITGPLLDRFAGVRSQYACAVLMMQREVGQKILAKPKDRERGALSVCLQAEFEISLVCKVPPGSFMPPPKVDSIVLKLIPRLEEVTSAFKKTVRAGFTQPRKTLINNFGATFRKERAEIAELVTGLGFEESVRAFELTEVEWRSVVEKTVALGWVS
jgi:16S rRNA (adenine1518-N6/adenine1519-N6)-dimethyltransferase